MNALELRLSRELIGLSLTEAAEQVGHVSRRSWEYWESGGRNVPNDVANTMNALVAHHREAIKMALKQDIERMSVIYYLTPEDCRSVVDWRLSQSIARTLALDFGARLVSFDKEQFELYCNEHNLEDNQNSRLRWAETVSKIAQNVKDKT